MKRLVIPLIFLIFISSCAKKDSFQLESPKGTEFFKSKTQLTTELKTAIGQDFGKLSSLTVKNIDYYEDQVKSIGLITYEANGQEYKNIVFVITATSKKLYKCTTDNCKCAVEISPIQGGGYSYECGGCNTDCHWEVSAI